jgi:beta-glucosidase
VVGAVDLTAGRPVEVVIEFATKPSRNLAFAAFRVGIGRPMGDAEIDEAVAAARQAEVALVFVGRNGEWDTEGSDLENIALPGRQDDLVTAVAAANPRTVVVLQTGGPVEMPWLAAVPAVVQAWYPGQECGNAIADVLTGAAEPGGRLPQTFPARWDDNPTASRDPEVYPGHNGRVRYAEGVFVGYRHYDRAGIEPLYSFGHGLGYTQFELSDLTGAPLADGARASVSVTNIGPRRGATVVQVWVGGGEPSAPRPVRELRAFEKLALDPGETRELSFDLAARALSYYDVGRAAWLAAKGPVEIAVGFSAADLRARATLTV